MNSFVLNKYLVSEFFKSFFNVILIFCCLGLILNLFEEINYFKNYDVGIGLPIGLSLMIIPSIVINMLPFITLHCETGEVDNGALFVLITFFIFFP